MVDIEGGDALKVRLRKWARSCVRVLSTSKLVINNLIIPNPFSNKKYMKYLHVTLQQRESKRRQREKSEESGESEEK